VRLADPYVLALLVLVPPLLFLRGRLSRGPGGRFSNLALLAGFSPTWRLRLRWMPTAVGAIALALLVFALARPQSGKAETQLPGQGIDVALVMDTSSSMSTPFGKDTRYGAAQRVLTDFIKNRHDDRIALVIFRESSLVLSPLTLDYNALTALVANVQQVNLSDGTAIGVGLADAVNLMRESKARSRAIIFLTDGENNSGAIEPLAAARIAETLGVRVYTIGVIDPRSRRSGNPGVDEKALQQMAEVTGGRYFPADSEQSLSDVYKTIDTLEKSRIGRTQYGAYDEYAPYLVVAALVLLAMELGLRATVWKQAS